MDINTTTIFITVALAHFVALLSPGPDFFAGGEKRRTQQEASGYRRGLGYCLS